MNRQLHYHAFAFLLAFFIVGLQFVCPMAALGQTSKITLPPKKPKIPDGDPPLGPSEKQKRIIKNLADNMVYVQGGAFTMGATPDQEKEAGRDEKPAHKVIVPSFSICKYEVTQEEWCAVMGKNPSCFKGDKRPVEQVSWNDCMKFIERLNTMTGKHFRLPTEAEWEYAARGGALSKGSKYAGGDNIEDTAWYYDNSNNETHEVGKRQANELGLYDMAGNVWEWCSDRKQDYDSPVEQQSENTTSTTDGMSGSDSYRVNRGGSWRSNAGPCRVSFRSDDSVDERLNTLGFRLAL